jgi:hypothetical protein
MNDINDVQMKFRENFIESINSANILYEDTKYQRNKYETLEMLTLENYIKAIKNLSNYPELINPNNVFNTRKWIEKINDTETKIDKRKKYDEKDYYEFTNNRILQLLELSDDYKLIDLITEGYESYNIDFHMRDLNDKYTIIFTIPDTSKITSNNHIYAHDGKFAMSVMYDNDKSTIHVLKTSYMLEEIVEFLKTFIAKEAIRGAD